MQQMILLEKPDLDAIKTGGTLTLHVGGATVMIGYVGRQGKLVGKVDDGVVTNGNKGKRHEKIPCVLCKKLIGPQGLAPHMAWHRRETAKGAKRK